MRQAKKASIPILLTLGFFLVIGISPCASAQDANAILKQVRYQQSAQERKMSGHLRVGRDSHRFDLTWDGGTMRYDFKQPAKAYIFTFGDKSARITEVTRSGRETVGAGRRDEELYASGMTFEDLSLEFLYWTDARVLGEDTIKSRKTWKIGLRPGRSGSSYRDVTIWVDQSTYSLMRVEARDAQGKIARKMEVIEVQQTEDGWFLKRMRIESFDPKNGKVRQRSWLEMD